MSVEFAVSTSTGWLPSAEVHAYKCSDSTYQCATPLTLQKQTEENKPAIIDISILSLCKGAPYKSICGLSIRSNARFVEVYTQQGNSEFEYIETIRGGLIDLNPHSSSQIFQCSSEKQMRCSSLRFKFVSVKVTPNTVQLENVKFTLVEKRINKDVNPVQTDGSSATTPVTAMDQGGSFGTMSGDSGTGQFSVMVEAVKLSLVQDISRLLDSKLAPITKKLEILDVRMSRLSSEVASLYGVGAEKGAISEIAVGGEVVHQEANPIHPPPHAVVEHSTSESTQGNKDSAITSIEQTGNLEESRVEVVGMDGPEC